jgi:hypothetical protein
MTDPSVSPTRLSLLPEATELVLEEVRTRAPGTKQFELFIPQEVVDDSLSMAVILDTLLSFGLSPRNFKLESEGRLYRYDAQAAE